MLFHKEFCYSNSSFDVEFMQTRNLFFFNWVSAVWKKITFIIIKYVNYIKDYLVVYLV